MWGHLGHADGAIYAIDGFFLLSGYLITGVLLGSWQRHGRVSLPWFWARRARRLFPALFLVLLFVAFYARFAAEPGELIRIRGDSLSTLFYANNWYSIVKGNSYFDILRVPSPLSHVWTLSVEEQYYVFWPLTVVGVLWWTRDRQRAQRLRALFWTAVVLGLSSAALTQVLLTRGVNINHLYLGTDTRAFALLAGSALAIGERRWGHLRNERLVRVLDQLLVLMITATLMMWLWGPFNSTAPFRYGFLLGDAVVIYMISVIANPKAWIGSALLSFKPLVWLGIVSYGLYLWHWPIFVWLTPDRLHMDKGLPYDLLVMGISVAVAALSFYLVEAPVLRGAISGRQALAVTPVAAGLVAVALVVSTAGGTTIEDQAVGLGMVPTKLQIAVGVPRPADPDRPHILVVGDSQAATLGQGFLRIQTSDDISAMNRGAVGCGIASGKPSTQFAGGIEVPDPPGCGNWPARWRSYLDSYDPTVALLIIGNPGLGKRFLAGQWRDACDPVYRATYEKDAEKALRLLASKGADVYVLTAPYIDATGTPASDYLKQYGPAQAACVNQAYRQASNAVANTRVIDLQRWLCGPSGTACKDEVDGIKMRKDRAHFQGDAAKLVDRWILHQLKPVSG